MLRSFCHSAHCLGRKPVDQVQADIAESGIPGGTCGARGRLGRMDSPQKSQVFFPKGLRADIDPVHACLPVASPPARRYRAGICLQSDFRIVRNEERLADLFQQKGDFGRASAGRGSPLRNKRYRKTIDAPHRTKFPLRGRRCIFFLKERSVTEKKLQYGHFLTQNGTWTYRPPRSGAPFGCS